MEYAIKTERFWFTYFMIRLFYLLFAVLVFPKLTYLGDPIAYMTRGFSFSISSSTDIMFLIGGLVGTILGGFNILSNFPFMLLSFYLIRWAINTLEIRRYISDKLLFFIDKFTLILYMDLYLLKRNCRTFLFYYFGNINHTVY